MISCQFSRSIPTTYLKTMVRSVHPILTNTSLVISTAGEYFLAELIESQDDQHKTIVAEVHTLSLSRLTRSSDISLSRSEVTQWGL